MMTDRRSRVALSRLALIVLAVAVASPARALVLPERMAILLPAKAEAPAVCGLVADYMVSDTVLRVEIGVDQEAAGQPQLFMRAYTPNSVGPIMRDIWLKTTTVFTLARFRPARENSNGILEARGAVSPQERGDILAELAQGDAEISLIFDGPLPAARLAVGLPRPLAIDLAGELGDCRARLEK